MLYLFTFDWLAIYVDIVDWIKAICRRNHLFKVKKTTIRAMAMDFFILFCLLNNLARIEVGFGFDFNLDFDFDLKLE